MVSGCSWVDVVQVWHDGTLVIDIKSRSEVVKMGKSCAIISRAL